MPIYMKFGTIKGEVTATGFKDMVELDSCSIHNARGIAGAFGSGGSREVGKLTFGDVQVSKQFDASSVEFFREALHGEGKDCEIHFTQSKEGGPMQDFLVVTLNDVLISSFSAGGGGGSAKPSESMTLNFAKIEYKVVTYDSKNKNPKPSTAAYDLQAAAPV